MLSWCFCYALLGLQCTCNTMHLAHSFEITLHALLMSHLLHLRQERRCSLQCARCGLLPCTGPMHRTPSVLQMQLLGPELNWHAGGVVGLLKALTGSHMPGKSLVIAEGNSLGRGPVIFHLSPSGIAMIRKHAAGKLFSGARLSSALH